MIGEIIYLLTYCHQQAADTPSEYVQVNGTSQ